MNEKLYASIACDTVANLIEKVGKVENMKKICSICCNVASIQLKMCNV
jgi:hypothetical protein